MEELSTALPPVTAAPAENTASTLIEAPKASRAQKTIRAVGWSLFALFCLILFTIAKLPEQRLKNYVQGTISSILSPRGITFTAKESRLSILFGLSYRMRKVTLLFPPPEPPTTVDEIEVSPSIFSLLLGRMGGSFYVENGDGVLKGSFSIKNGANGPGDGSVTLKANKMDFGKLAVLPLATGMRGSFTLSGNASLSGDFSQPSSLNGDIDLKLSRLTIDSQSFMGFSIPRINVSEGAIELGIDKGKATVRKLQIGKPGSPDDLIASVTGDLALGKQLDASTLNLKTRFSLSQTVLKSFSLVDMILGAGKQADGAYAYSLTGPLLAPTPTPMK